MRFSVDQESVADIIASLTSYSDEIDSAFDKFQDEIKIIAIRTNYNKMLIALQNIIDIYNNVICGSMRERLINIWLEEGESLHSFAEDVYMGEESEDAVRRIESNLGDIFSINYNNSLLELEFEGDSKVTKEDFDEAVKCFESFKKEIELISETNSEYFENKIEDNELYRFLIPIIEAISVGIAVFSDSARTDMERLGDNYVEKMVSLKEKVEEAKSESKPMDFDLDLFDFDDNISATIPSSATPPTIPSEVDRNKSKSIEHIKNIGERMQKDFAPGKTDRKPIERILEYANADNLASDIRNFSASECNRDKQILSGYQKAIVKLDNDYKQAVAFENNRFSKLLNDLYKQLEKDLQIARKDLERRYVKRTISSLMGRDLYQESINRANQLYNERQSALQQQYNYEMIRLKNIREAKRQTIETRKQELYSSGAISQCIMLYNKRIQYAADVENNVSNIERIIQSLVQDIAKNCDSPCSKLAKIYQDVYLKCKPSVNGFSSDLLGHRITVNEKRKSWINTNLRDAELKEVSADGILNMKTPVHEYLHYLSNGENGTSGVKNMDTISTIANRTDRNTMILSMTGFNEGITEMFAQDYLRDEIFINNNFVKQNDILEKEKNIIRQKSYRPQVDVVRSICKILGGDQVVRDAYINHDFSNIENAVNNAMQKKGKSFDWLKAKNDMAIIQDLYTDKNPDVNIRKQNNIKAQKISQRLIKELEA